MVPSPALRRCTIAVTVTGSSTAGAKLTSTSSALTNGARDHGGGRATLYVYAVPTVVGNRFTPPTIAAGRTSTLTITVATTLRTRGNLTGVSIRTRARERSRTT
ncbi:MAG: hypothetical protein IPH30_05355 [Betaproteobacteria bacterium]|nr:hypothetical protein [Betaproteobacteria bacterium]